MPRRIIFHVDIAQFFASVEELEHPEFKNVRASTLTSRKEL